MSTPVKSIRCKQKKMKANVIKLVEKASKWNKKVFRISGIINRDLLGIKRHLSGLGSENHYKSPRGPKCILILRITMIFQGD